MNFIKYILLLVFSFIFFNNSNAQKQETELINSGYVFIDGKYIEPPYILKSVKGSLYLNGNLISKKTDWNKLKKEKNRLKKKNYGNKPTIPTNLSKNSNLDDINKLKYSGSDMPYTSATYNYFYKTCSFEDAIDSIADYYRSLPNIKEFYRTKENSSVWYMEAYNGENRKFILGSPISKQKYNKINKLNNTPIDSLKKQMSFAMNANMQNFEEDLKSNEILLFFPDKDIKSYINYLKFSLNDFSFIHTVLLNENIINSQKEILINEHFGYNTEFYNILIKEIIANYKFNSVFIDVMSKYISINNTEKKNKKVNIEEKIFDGSGYSPYSKKLMAWCPNEYELAFNMFHTQEIQNIKSYIDNQDFIWDNYNDIFIDNSPSDDDGGNNISYGECTYQNFIDMKNSGIVYVATHGLDYGDGILIRFMTSENEANNWHGNNVNMYEAELNPFDVDAWDNNTDLWTVVAKKEWFETNWKPDLINNNSIVIFSVCYSANYGYIDSYGGGATLAYTDLSSWNDYDINDNSIPGTGIEANNRELFKRMNGSIENGDKREVYDAYNDINNKYFGFSLTINSDLTLCPAPLQNGIIPEPYTSVPTTTNNGYIEFDTWCDTTKNPLSAITLSGNISGVNASWDNPQGGKSKQLNFSWTSATGTITVNVYPDYIVSYGGGEHKLDFDRQTPNGEIGTYMFTIDEDIPTGPSIANFNYTISGNQVSFEDLSTQSPTNWLWNFGDYSSSTSKNVSHTYQGNGTYTVSLTVSNSTYTGSNTKTENIIIDGTSSSYLVSGRVLNASSGYEGIDGATVSFENLGSVTTYTNGNKTGYYEKTAPYNWSGNITATKSGFNSQSISINNPVYQDIENQNFYLFEQQGLYISATQNQNSNSYDFEIVGQTSNIWYYNWNFGDGGTCENPFCTHGYVEDGNYTISVRIYDNNYTELTPPQSITINITSIPPDTTRFFPKFTINCGVADIGTGIIFKDISTHSMNKECWQWFFDAGQNHDDYQGEGTSPVYCKSFNSTVEPYLLTMVQPYSTIGKKIIKLQTYEENTSYINFESYDAKCNGVKLYNCRDYWAAVNVIDCDKESFFINDNNFNMGFFLYAVMDSWEYDHNGGPINIYGGSFKLNGSSNNYLNLNKYKISACNQIEINGDVEFYADGSKELILTSGEIPNCNNAKITEPTISNKSDINTNNYEFNANIYPNPFTNEFTVEIDLLNSQNIKFEISDINGKIISTQNNKTIKGINTFTINAKNLTNGIYFFKIYSNETNKTFKLVKTF